MPRVNKSPDNPEVEKEGSIQKAAGQIEELVGRLETEINLLFRDTEKVRRMELESDREHDLSEYDSSDVSRLGQDLFIIHSRVSFAVERIQYLRSLFDI